MGIELDAGSDASSRVFGEQPGDGLGAGGGLDPTHRAAAAAAVLGVGAEQMPEEPTQAGTTRVSRVGVRRVHGQGLLITRGGQRREEAGLWLGGWGDFVAQRMMA
jgi:hypothetical protein